jgi:hypothetical protein
MSFWEANSRSSTQEFPNSYGSPRFVTVITRGWQYSLSWTRWIQSILPQPVSLRSTLTVSSHLRPGHPSGFFLAFPPNYVCIFHAYYIPCPSHPSWLHHYDYIWQELQRINLLIMRFYSTSGYFFPLESKYSSQQPVLKHPQSMFLP